MGYFELLQEIFPKLLSGMGLTLQMTAVSLLIAVFLGLFACMLKIAKWKILQFIAGIYVDVIRGTPMLVQAIFIYFGVAQLMDRTIPPFTAAIITLSLNAGAYMCEIFRSGINAVSQGQMEAARSLGMPYSKAMMKVILPQAFRIVIPSLVNQFIITLKDTSILSVIGVMELTKTAQIIVARNFRSFEIYATVGVMYFVIIEILSLLSKQLERRMSYGKGKH